jgi:hypothetical protein
MKKYKIAADRDYGWLTGLAHDGRQLLAADSVNLYFDRDGSLLQVENVSPEQAWQERAMKLIAVPGPVQVQEFSVEGHDISVRPLPERYAGFLRTPESFSPEEQSQSAAAIADWEKNQLFEFRLGDDFWMKPDGSVDSH